MGGCTNPMFLLVDNSDSPSLVEQSQQGDGSSCYTLLAVVPSSMKCLMPYACQVASCSMGISLLCFLFLFLCSYVPCVLLFSSHLISLSTWVLQPLFIQGVFSLNPGIACLTMCTLG